MDAQSQSKPRDLRPAKWGIADIQRAGDGLMSPEEVCRTTRSGLTVVDHAALKAASAADALLTLLDEPEPGEDKVQEIINLLTVIASGQLRIMAALDELRGLGGRGSTPAVSSAGSEPDFSDIEFQN